MARIQYPSFRIFILLFSLTLLSSCHTARYFTRNLAGPGDYRIFPCLHIAGNPAPSGFPRSTLPLPETGGLQTGYEDLEELLIHTRTNSFLILHHDSLVFEWYAEGQDEGTMASSFSIAKTVVSTMVGIALEEGDIPSLDTPVSVYLPELHPSLSAVTFRQLLDMRAGLNFRERYLTPFSPMARYYYGRRLDRYILRLRSEDSAGRRYEYQSAATQLVGMALERATRTSWDTYLAEKLWIPAGMPQGTTWSTDRENGVPKFFCCLNVRPHDLARYGNLFVHGGRYGDRQILSEEWIAQITGADTGSRDSQGYPYSLGWRLTPEGGLFAKGVLGQYVYA
ncbi:MAG TPA: serine hydrolase, partial [Bacteroidales bacterium]|nr:serine hydrolase [Bacteroidales bacterium]